MQARKMALCGMLCALAVVLMALGGIIPVALYCAPLLAVAVLLPVREECGIRLALTAWAAVSVLSILLVADRELAGVFLFFGWYGAAQPWFQRIRRRAVRGLCKLAAYTVAAAGLYVLLIFLLGAEVLAAEFSQVSRWMAAAFLLLGALVFLLADQALLRLSLLWRSRLRQRLGFF